MIVTSNENEPISSLLFSQREMAELNSRGQNINGIENIRHQQCENYMSEYDGKYDLYEYMIGTKILRLLNLAARGFSREAIDSVTTKQFYSLVISTDQLNLFPSR